MEMKALFEYLDNRARELVKYSDKLRETFKEFDEIFTPLFKRAGVYYTDKEPLSHSEYDTYYLKIGKKKDGEWGFLKNGEFDSYYITNESRAIIKKVVLKLPVFLEEYKNQLDKTTEEYKQASEMIEIMNNAIKEFKEEEA